MTYVPKPSRRFCAPNISVTALPNKPKLETLRSELDFEKRIATDERDAFKVLHDGGAKPESIKGSVARLRALGG